MDCGYSFESPQSKNKDCGYSLEPPSEAVLTCTHNLCFEQKYENNQNISTENCHFYSCEKIAVCCMGGFS